jgi:hypothetical protein
MVASTLDGAAHVVQLALTPIFFLAGLATLLNVFTVRLGRVADRVDLLTRDANSHPRQLRMLILRSQVLDIAVLLASVAGGLTCAAALVLFFGALWNAGGGALLFGLFGGALGCSVLALLAFAVETLLSGRSIRDQAKSGTPDEDRG